MNNLKLILQLLGYGIASFVLIHFFSVLGIFLVAGFPIWWLLHRESAFCIGCRMAGKGRPCRFCGSRAKDEKEFYPKSASSMMVNMGLLFVITFFSAGFVYGESKLMGYVGWSPAKKTVVFTIPSHNQHRLLEIFSMDVVIEGVEQPINAIQADLSFDPDRLQILSVNLDESFSSIFIQKDINNEAGFVRVTGGVPNPGFSDDKGIFARIIFQAKQPGLASVEYLPSSLVLANDGHGSNVLREYAKVSYLILPDSLTDQELETQNKLFTQAPVLGASSDNDKLMLFEESTPALPIQSGLETSNQSTVPGAALEVIDSVFLWWAKYLPS